MIPKLRRTKIVATVGPATDDPGILAALLGAGVDCVRVNMSHGTHDDHRRRLREVREIAGRLGRPIALLADLQGPKLRVALDAAPRTLQVGDQVSLAGAADAATGDVPLGIDLDLAAAVRPGGDILVADGAIRLRATSARDRRLQCEVIVGGLLEPGKGVALPGARLPLSSLTDKDHEDLALALAEDVDYVALSFVRRGEDVEDLKRAIRRASGRARVIAKIERAEAMRHLESIIDASDGVMVARGDLGVEISPEEVPLAQKRIVQMGLEAGKPVITATQMLESMIEDPVPTRAEASDVANAILDGTGAVMLSGETAIGRYPVEAVSTMVRIALAVEPSLAYHEASFGLTRLGPRYIADVVGHAACDIAETLGAAAIVVPTVTGESAREVSKHRPRRPIVAASGDAGVLSQLALVWAVVPIDLPPATGVEDLWRGAADAVQRTGLAGPGDRIVITAGTLVNRPGSTNTIHVLAL